MDVEQTGAPAANEPEAFRVMQIKRLEAINESLRNELMMQQQLITALRIEKAADAAAAAAEQRSRAASGE